jgi:hypothetical protein
MIVRISKPFVALVLFVLYMILFSVPGRAEEVDIAGTWNSNIGAIYEITQDGLAFQWYTNNLGWDENATGTITGSTVSASWSGKHGSGTATGTVVSGREGIANRIEWTNGVVFSR